MAATVLVTTADLEPAVRLREAFQEEGYRVELLTPGEHVADVEDPILLVLTGGLDEKQARRLVREARSHDGLPIVALLEPTGQATPDTRRRLGVTEVVSKPIDPADTARLGKRLIERQRLRTVTGVVGETDEIIEVLERIVQFAPVSSTVLLTGESGTGKERAARGIHALSPRRHKPFIPANVAALPETLLESELFGHEKGSFTGAIGQRKGLFELAHKGTLFLDEIGELPQATQAKLLRVLEEREFMRLGGEQSLKVDVRVIAATNQPLRQLVEVGHFRRDLYYRLNILAVHLPPLRERRGDIPLLMDAFMAEAAAEHGRPRITVEPDAMRTLVDYEWPGNVRELKNLVESMVVLSHGAVIRPEDVPPEIRDRRAASRLLPVPIPRPPARDTEDREGAATPPELEFVFRTLVQLRMDVDDLSRRFEEYRDAHPELISGRPGLALPAPYVHRGVDVTPDRSLDDVPPGEGEEYTADEHAEVVFRPGMTLKDLEREAILAALKEVGGNRRKAAEMLDMGERTLYRKIKEYGIPL
ncbi:MAG: sigma-54 dependent transcriptional regulator [Gemmatimonadota bacterium]